MIILVIGGSNSGKSEYAEQCLDRFQEDKFYIATMIASDEESRERVSAHQKRRRGRGFETIECPADLGKAASQISMHARVLLEGIGTLAANELFGGYDACDKQAWNEERFMAAKSRILDGIKALSLRTGELVIVSDEVNRAGCEYEGDTLLYQRLIGELNQELCRLSDVVVEMVCGCPVVRKPEIKKVQVIGYERMA